MGIAFMKFVWICHVITSWPYNGICSNYLKWYSFVFGYHFPPSKVLGITSWLDKYIFETPLLTHFWVIQPLLRCNKRERESLQTLGKWHLCPWCIREQMPHNVILFLSWTLRSRWRTLLRNEEEETRTSTRFDLI